MRDNFLEVGCNLVYSCWVRRNADSSVSEVQLISAAVLLHDRRTQWSIWSTGIWIFWHIHFAHVSKWIVRYCPKCGIGGTAIHWPAIDVYFCRMTYSFPISLQCFFHPTPIFSFAENIMKPRRRIPLWKFMSVEMPQFFRINLGLWSIGYLSMLLSYSICFRNNPWMVKLFATNRNH